MLCHLHRIKGAGRFTERLVASRKLRTLQAYAAFFYFGWSSITENKIQSFDVKGNMQDLLSRWNTCLCAFTLCDAQSDKFFDRGRVVVLSHGLLNRHSRSISLFCCSMILYLTIWKLIAERDSQLTTAQTWAGGLANFKKLYIFWGNCSFYFHKKHAMCIRHVWY